jgi:hypothetical protein
MSNKITVRWQDWSGTGLEHLVLREDPDGITAEAVILATAEDEGFAARYRILCDESWRVKKAEIARIGYGHVIELAGDGAGNWVDGSASPMPRLAGAIDIDISITPFTNTLPIRRLRLKTGQSEDILAVYIQLPEITVTTDRQRYTCLEPNRRYRYESLDSDFTRDIEVDGHGLVLTYPGLFRRVM